MPNLTAFLSSRYTASHSFFKGQEIATRLTATILQLSTAYSLLVAHPH